MTGIRAVLAIVAGLLVIVSCATRPLATTTERDLAWQEDLDTAVDTFLPRDPALTAAEREEFRRALDRLRDSIPRLTDEEIIVRIAMAVARSNEGHRRAFLLRNEAYFGRYPIRVWWFADGLYVVAARPEHRELVGQRIVAIADEEVERAAERVKPVYAGTDSWRRYKSTYLLTSPEVLHGVGLLASTGPAAYTMEDEEGARNVAVLQPMTERRAQPATESWWALSPLHPGTEGPWVHALPADPSELPHYLRQPTRWYWFEHLPAEDILYLQLNRSGEMEDAPFAAFQEAFLDQLERRQPGRLVIDLRFNTGGNLNVTQPLIERIARTPLAQEPGRLFVITGGQTFSAGITHTAYLAANANPVLVGERVGDVLDFWSEGRDVLLPNSKLYLHHVTRFHAYSTRDYPELRERGLIVVDLNSPKLEPDLPVLLTFADYRSLRDPALEAVGRH